MAKIVRIIRQTIPEKAINKRERKGKRSSTKPMSFLILPDLYEAVTKEERRLRRREAAGYLFEDVD